MTDIDTVVIGSGMGGLSAATALMLGGASTLAHGIHGAALSGLAAAGHVLGCRPTDMLKADQPKIKTYLADDPTDGPEVLCGHE